MCRLLLVLPDDMPWTLEFRLTGGESEREMLVDDLTFGGFSQLIPEPESLILLDLGSLTLLRRRRQ